MKKTLAVLATVATVGATAVTAPAPAEARGIGVRLGGGRIGRRCGSERVSVLRTGLWLL